MLDLIRSMKSIVFDTSHERPRIWDLPVYFSGRKVEAWVLLLETFQQQRLINLLGFDGI